MMLTTEQQEEAIKIVRELSKIFLGRDDQEAIKKLVARARELMKKDKP